MRIAVYNRLRPRAQAAAPRDRKNKVNGAQVILNPVAAGDSGPQQYLDDTDRNGLSEVDINQLGVGWHTIRIVPPHASTWPAGPTTGENIPDRPARLYCQADIRLQTRTNGNSLTIVPGSAVMHPNSRDVGEVTLLQQAGRFTLRIDLQPVYAVIKQKSTRNENNIDMIVVHRTGSGNHTGNTINYFGGDPNNNAGANYIVARDDNPIFDGRVVKLTPNNWQGNHPGVGSQWGRQTNLNQRSIGIEISCIDHEHFTEAQITSLINLLGVLCATHGIDSDRIIGHSDVVNFYNRRANCTGVEFPWPQLETATAANSRGPFGLSRGRGTELPPLQNGERFLGGFFDEVPEGSLRNNDTDRFGSDDRRRLGAAKRHRDAIDGTPINDVSQWLRDIGYDVTAGPRFNNELEDVVKKFQAHFFASDTSTFRPNGRIDRSTAALIYNVRESNRTYA